MGLLLGPVAQAHGDGDGRQPVAATNLDLTGTDVRSTHAFCHFAFHFLASGVVGLRVNQAQGSVLIDDAVDFAKNICNSNSNAILFCLLPQYHTSLDMMALLQHRRLIEDKLSGRLDD